MDCCQCEVIESEFDQKYALKQLKKYRKKGPKKTAIKLIEVIQKEAAPGATLLDIGGGVGDIQHALLKMGISKTYNAEASTGHLEACKSEAERQGHADKISHHQGNFVDLVEEIPSTDIVTLDRVICCFDEMEKLVDLSSKKARHLYGLVYPRETWWVKLGIAVDNFLLRIQCISMRVFVHSPKEVEAIINKNGLKRIFYEEKGVWQVVLFSR